MNREYDYVNGDGSEGGMGQAEAGESAMGAAQPDAMQADAILPDAGQANPSQPDAAQANAIQLDAVQADASQTGGAGQANPSQPDAMQPDAMQADASQTGAMQADASLPGAGQANPGQPDAGQANPSQPDTGKTADAGLGHASQTDSVQIGTDGYISSMYARAQNEPMAREEWELLQREIQDRAWQIQQDRYRKQIEEEQLNRNAWGNAGWGAQQQAGPLEQTGYPAGQAGFRRQDGGFPYGQPPNHPQQFYSPYQQPPRQAPEHSPYMQQQPLQPQQQQQPQLQQPQQQQIHLNRQQPDQEREREPFSPEYEQYQQYKRYQQYQQYQQYQAQQQNWLQGAGSMGAFPDEDAIPVGGRAGKAQSGANGENEKGKGKGKGKRALRVLAFATAAALLVMGTFASGYFIGNQMDSMSKAPLIGGLLDGIGGAGNSQGARDASGETENYASGAAEFENGNDNADANGNTDADADANGNADAFPPMQAAGPDALPGDPAAGFPRRPGDNPIDKANSDAYSDAQTVAQPSTLASGLLSLTQNEPTGKDLTVAEIYKKVYPSIVGVRVTFQQTGMPYGFFMMPNQQELSGEGSGIIIREDGYIMTNEHVVTDTIDKGTRKQAANTKIEVILPDDVSNAYQATLIGYDTSTDLAVLKIDKKGLPAAELGNSDKLEVGGLAVAIGNPAGLEYISSVTAGVISGLNRSLQTEGYRNIQLIQTDAAINPGNSGGALINSKGQVIGVNSVKIASSQYEGLGFAIPINAAVKICDDLMNFNYVKGRPYIGITAYSQYNEQMAEQYNMPKGVYIYEVISSGPAGAAGLRKNDIIVKFNGKAVNNFAEMEKAKNEMKPGDRVSLQVYRDWSTNDYTSGRYVDITLTLGEMEAN